MTQGKEPIVSNLEWIEREVKLGELKPYERNPRWINEDAFSRLVKSLKEDGYHTRIKTTPSLLVVGGHQRIKALKAIGLTNDSPIKILVPSRELTEEEFRRILIVDNLPFGSYDYDVLSADYTIEELVSYGMDENLLLGLNKDEKKEGHTDEDESPAPPKNPITVLGDVWNLGNHRLVCGDSTMIDTVKKLMGEEKANMLLTDPPYNVAYEGKTKDALTIKNDAMTDDSFRKFLRDAFTCADAFMHAGAVFYIWHADSEGFNFRGACRDVAWKVRQCLIWNKNTIVLGRQDYHWKHEPCLYGWKDGASHFWASDRKQATVIECKKPSRNAEHPTMKPVELMDYQIRNNTKTGDIVLDLFGGSGSTMIAAEISGRRSMCVELDPVYCDVIVQRWQNFTGKKAMHESGQSFEELSVSRPT